MKYIVMATHYSRPLGKEVKEKQTVELTVVEAKPYLDRLEPKPLTDAQQKKADREAAAKADVTEDETEVETETE